MSFQEKMCEIEKIEGMLTPFSAAVMDCLLDLQTEIEVKGNIFEFGCYKGKTASLLSSYIRESEILNLIDINNWEQSLAKIHLDEQVWNFYQKDTLHNSNFIVKKLGKNKNRFAHLDTSHTYEITLNEIKMASKLVNKYGIIVIDDFTNLNYLGVMPAVYKFLFKNKNWKLFLTTTEKAFICKKKSVQTYESFILTKLNIEMKKRGFDTTLARTDNSPFSSGFFIRTKGLNETEIYAESMYKEFFKKAFM